MPSLPSRLKSERRALDDSRSLSGEERGALLFPAVCFFAALLALRERHDRNWKQRRKMNERSLFTPGYEKQRQRVRRDGSDARKREKRKRKTRGTMTRACAHSWTSASWRKDGGGEKKKSDRRLRMLARSTRATLRAPREHAWRSV